MNLAALIFNPILLIHFHDDGFIFFELLLVIILVAEDHDPVSGNRLPRGRQSRRVVDLVDALRCAISCSELRTSCSRAVWYSSVTAGACIAISAKPNAAASGIEWRSQPAGNIMRPDRAVQPE